MKTKLLLVAVSVAALGSCTTLYKSGQTPDDVYYSPARTYVENRQDDRVERVDNNRYYNSEDVMIRMGINDPRWRYLNDYAYTPYSYGFNHGYYYNPYFWPYPVYSPVFTAPTNPKITTPRMNNLGGYGSIPGYNNTQVNPKTGRTVPVRSYNNSNNGTAVGNALRKVLGSDTYNSNTNNSTNNNSNNNNRTYTPSSSSSSSSSGSRPSSSGSVSRPPRGGN
ncbi:MAG: hypothetical protein V4725_07095 [Bacteroidota bacterium]|nr:hypothetical protein [Ferruginibacter sp.]